MNTIYTKRLSRDTQYKKKTKSYQESLSPDEIKEKLEEYKQVDNIDEVPLSTHLRYFTIDPKTGKKEFRLGGFLTKINDDYVVISNGNFSWSVQKKTSVFFQKLNFKELKDDLVKKISKKFEKQLSDLVDENSKLKDTLKEVKKTIRKKSK
jgi:hypothetical protein